MNPAWHLRSTCQDLTNRFSSIYSASNTNRRHIGDRLVRSCAVGDYDAVIDLLGDGVNPAEKSSALELLPIIAACANNHPVVLQLLLSQNANVNERDGQGLTALMVAAALGHTKCVEVLIEHGVDVYARDKDNIPAFFYAAASNTSDVLAYLYSHGVSPNYSTETGNTVLYMACAMGNYNIVHYLASIETDLHVKQKETECYPVTAAVLGGHLSIIEMFHECAYPYFAAAVASYDQCRHIIYAHPLGPTVMKILAENNVFMGLYNDPEIPMLMEHACRRGKESLVATLLEARCDPNIMLPNSCAYTTIHFSLAGSVLSLNVNSNTPLEDLLTLRAAITTPVVTTLIPVPVLARQPLPSAYLDRRVLPGHLASSKFTREELTQPLCTTPLAIAAANGHYHLVTTLLERGAYVDYRASRADTALTAACKIGSKAVAEALLDFGARACIASTLRQTPLALCQMLGHSELGKIIFEECFAIFETERVIPAKILSEIIRRLPIGRLRLRSRPWSPENPRCEAFLPQYMAFYGTSIARQILRFMVKTGAQLFDCDDRIPSPLLVACHFGNASIVKVLLRVAKPYLTRWTGSDNPYHQIPGLGAVWGFPIETAALRGHAKVVQLLLDAGADLNGDDVRPPLVLPPKKTVAPAPAPASKTTSKHTRGKGVASLLAKQSTVPRRQLKTIPEEEKLVLAPTQAGFERIRENMLWRVLTTPLFVRGSRDMWDIVNLLMRRGARVPVGYHDIRVTVQACAEGHIPLLVQLFRAGAELDAYDDQGETPLTRACTCGHDGVVRLLVNWGANVNLCTIRGRHALQCIEDVNDTVIRERIERLLREAGAQIPVPSAMARDGPAEEGLGSQLLKRELVAGCGAPGCINVSCRQTLAMEQTVVNAATHVAIGDVIAATPSLSGAAVVADNLLMPPPSWPAHNASGTTTARGACASSPSPPCTHTCGTLAEITASLHETNAQMAARMGMSYTTPAAGLAEDTLPPLYGPPVAPSRYHAGAAAEYSGASTGTTTDVAAVAVAIDVNAAVSSVVAPTTTITTTTNTETAEAEESEDDPEALASLAAREARLARRAKGESHVPPTVRTTIRQGLSSLAGALVGEGRGARGKAGVMDTAAKSDAAPQRGAGKGRGKGGSKSTAVNNTIVRNNVRGVSSSSSLSPFGDVDEWTSLHAPITPTATVTTTAINTPTSAATPAASSNTLGATAASVATTNTNNNINSDNDHNNDNNNNNDDNSGRPRAPIFTALSHNVALLCADVLAHLSPAYASLLDLLPSLGTSAPVPSTIFPQLDNMEVGAAVATYCAVFGSSTVSVATDMGPAGETLPDGIAGVPFHYLDIEKVFAALLNLALNDLRGNITNALSNDAHRDHPSVNFVAHTLYAAVATIQKQGAIAGMRPCRTSSEPLFPGHVPAITASLPLVEDMSDLLPPERMYAVLSSPYNLLGLLVVTATAAITLSVRQARDSAVQASAARAPRTPTQTSPSASTGPPASTTAEVVVEPFGTLTEFFRHLLPADGPFGMMTSHIINVLTMLLPHDLVSALTYDDLAEHTVAIFTAQGRFPPAGGAVAATHSHPILTHTSTDAFVVVLASLFRVCWVAFRDIVSSLDAPSFDILFLRFHELLSATRIDGMPADTPNAPIAASLVATPIASGPVAPVGTDVVATVADITAVAVAAAMPTTAVSAQIRDAGDVFLEGLLAAVSSVDAAANGGGLADDSTDAVNNGNDTGVIDTSPIVTGAAALAAHASTPFTTTAGTALMTTSASTSLSTSASAATTTPAAPLTGFGRHTTNTAATGAPVLAFHANTRAAAATATALSAVNSVTVALSAASNTNVSNTLNTLTSTSTRASIVNTANTATNTPATAPATVANTPTTVAINAVVSTPTTSSTASTNTDQTNATTHIVATTDSSTASSANSTTISFPSENTADTTPFAPPRAVHMSLDAYLSRGAFRATSADANPSRLATAFTARCQAQTAQQQEPSVTPAPDSRRVSALRLGLRLPTPYHTPPAPNALRCDAMATDVTAGLLNRTFTSTALANYPMNSCHLSLRGVTLPVLQRTPGAINCTLGVLSTHAHGPAAAKVAAARAAEEANRLAQVQAAMAATPMLPARAPTPLQRPAHASATATTRVHVNAHAQPHAGISAAASATVSVGVNARMPGYLTPAITPISTPLSTSTTAPTTPTLMAASATFPSVSETLSIRPTAVPTHALANLPPLVSTAAQPQSVRAIDLVPLLSGRVTLDRAARGRDNTAVDAGMSSLAVNSYIIAGEERERVGTTSAHVTHAEPGADKKKNKKKK